MRSVYCTSLTGVYFQGNAPTVYSSVFYGDNNAIVYYLPGTTGWGTPGTLFGGLPTVMLSPPPFTYTTNNGTITITKYTGSGGAVTIPDTINGLPVTGIGGSAFYGCTNLSSVTIGNSVSSIGPWVFDHCTSLTMITVDGSNPSYSSMDGVLFNKNQTTLIQCPGAKSGSYTVSNSVTFIDYGAFEGWSSLTNLTIANSVTSIGGEAFAGCTGLTNLEMKNVTSIGYSAFAGCASLKSGGSEKRFSI